MEEEDTLGSFFISQDYVIQQATLQDITQNYWALNSASTDYDLTGQVIWPGATVLAEYLLTHSSIIQGKTVLELGAGTGLTGLFISHLTYWVILTDGNEIVMNVLSKNVEFARGKCSAVQVEWGKEALEREGYPGKYEVIIGADVVYWEDSIEPLYHTVKALLAQKGKFVMCYTLRALRVQKKLLEKAEEMGLKIQELAVNGASYIYEISLLE
jgi:predicted nicotinamide N-methyase